MKKPDLSIIILNFNTKDLLRGCLNSLGDIKNEVSCEVIVADNGSGDGSLDMVKNEFPWVKSLDNKVNLGFAKGNNTARKMVNGKYVLFLNSDTKVLKGSLSGTLKYIGKNENVGAITCKILLPDGKLDKDARRRFPTPWISLKRLFLGMGGQYWYSDIPENKVHEVDVIQGAFFMARKDVLDKVGWFDEDYFLNGEDIDLCWKIKNAGYKIIYFPGVSILHLKKESKSKNRGKSQISGVEAMEIFYRKRLWNKYPLILNLLVIFGIRVLKILRTL